MKCSQVHENLAASLEGLLDPRQTSDIERHLEECAACRTDAARVRQLHARLTADGEALRTRSRADAVMVQILREQTQKLRRNAMRRRLGKIGFGMAATAAVLALFVIPWGGASSNQATAAQVLASAVDALTNLRSVHIKLRMRTSPHDNFELILPNHAFVTIEMWKEFGDPPRWRAEEPGRVVVMDGESTLCHIKPDQAFRREAAATFRTWIGALMNVDKLLENQLQLAERKGWSARVEEMSAADGRKQLVVTVDAPPDADFENGNDYLRNKSISDSQRRCVYQFDAATRRLEDLQVWVALADREVLVLDVESITYNDVLDDALFALELPDDVIWLEPPAILPDNEKYADMTPGEAARAFFAACAAEDWDEAGKYLAASRVPDGIKLWCGGLEIIALGEPFQSGNYAGGHGWFVPYEIKLKSGAVKKHNLALRNDNPAKRWMVDGGL